MKDVIILRGQSTAQGSFGTLISDNYRCHTLELPWQDNKRQKSCIPIGQYVCELVESPKFGWVYTVKNVPGRSHILFHSGNLAGDVDLGWTTQVQGCILLGKRFGQMLNKFGNKQDALLISRPAVFQFMQSLRKQPFLLKVQ